MSFDTQPENLAIDPKTTAIVLIEFQNDLFILRSTGIQTVVRGGFLTSCCVESTMRSAYENGYEVITLNDCVAATSQGEHDNALKYDFPMFSKPMSAEAFLAQV